MYVRIFCQPTSDELGTLTRRLIDVVLIELGMDVCLLPITQVNFGELRESDWSNFQHLFNRMYDGPFFNVVASNDYETWRLLWTTNVTNFLVTTSMPPPVPSNHIVHLGAFQGVILPPLRQDPTGVSSDLLPAWKAIEEKARIQPITIPFLWDKSHADAIRNLILT